MTIVDNQVFYVKVFVPHAGVNAWFFDFVCPGFSMSVPHERLLLHKNSTVIRNLDFDKLCKEKQVVYAIKNHQTFFEVSDAGKLVKYPLRPYLGFKSIAWDWEVLAAFFEFYNVKPKFIICDTWGILNYTTGQFTAAVGMIQRDEADVAAAGFAVVHSRSKVAEYTQGVTYYEIYWLTRFPKQLDPTWNLLGLFTPLVWMFIGLSILSVSMFLIISSRCYRDIYQRIKYVSTRVVLIPFRCTTEY